MRTRSRRAACGVALAERQRACPARSIVGDRDAAARRVEADEVAHAHVGAELRRPRAEQRRSPASVRPTSVARSRGSAGARLVAASSAEVGAAGTSAPARRRARATRLRVAAAVTVARRPDRLAALRDARHQRHLVARTPRPTGRPASTPSATCSAAAARRRQRRRTGSPSRCGRPSRRSVRRRSGVAGSACTSARARRRSRCSGARPRTPRSGRRGSAASISTSAGSSKYSTPLAATPTPTLPTQSTPRPALPQRRQQRVGVRRVVVGEVDEAERQRPGAAGLVRAAGRRSAPRPAPARRASRGGWRGRRGKGASGVVTGAAAFSGCVASRRLLARRRLAR